MQLRYLKIFFLFIVLNGLCNFLHAQAKFTAKVSSPVIGKDETVELKLLVENASSVQQITAPSLNNFTVISGPNQESGMESVNGNTRQYVGITFILRPKSKGEFVIAPSTAKADGKILHSNSVRIKVSNAAQGTNQPPASPFSGLMGFDEPVAETSFNDFILKKGEKLYDKIKKNIFIKVVTDKNTCFVGEPIVVSYKLYTRLKSESNIAKSPSFNDFSVIDLLPPGNNSYSVEKLDGRSYNVYTLRKAQLYPLQAGPLGLESAEVENNVHFVKEEYLKSNGSRPGDLFGDILMPPQIPPEGMLDEKITLQSKPEVINVKPLPETNKPASFAGAVGNFTIESVLEKNSFTTDDAGKLIITISGEGNLTMVNAPEIVWPEGLEAFEPKAEEELNKQRVPVSGSKTFAFPFSVSKAGTYTLPAIEFSYFDLASGKYKTLSAKSLQVNVAKGTGARIAAAIPADNKSNKEKFFDTIFTNRWMIIAPVALLIFIGLFVWLSRENKKEAVINTAEAVSPSEEIAEKKEAVTLPENPLAVSEERLVQQDSKGFYEAINKELKLFLSKELHLPSETLQKKNIEDAMDKKGLPLHTSLQIQQLLDAIEWQLYTPYADENKMLEIFDKANALVHAFKKAAV